MRRLVDAMNVIGSRPDGWWRDREAAMRRLVDAVDEDAVVVLDSGPPDLAARPNVVIASRRGRDAADDEIVRLVAEDPDVRVVTSDAALAARVRALGASVEGASAFRRSLDY